MLTSNSEKRKNGRHTHLPPQQRPHAHRPALKVRGAQAALGASVPATATVTLSFQGNRGGLSLGEFVFSPWNRKRSASQPHFPHPLSLPERIF